MRTELRSKVTLLFIMVAALIAIPAVGAFAQETTDSTGPETSNDPATTTSATIQSDKDDYAPGELVSLWGSNWTPGDSVHINVNDDEGKTWSRDVAVTV